MRIWQLYFYDDDKGATQHWYASKRDAEKQRTKYRRMDRAKRDEMIEMYGRDISWAPTEYEITSHDVPTKKVGLVKFLNILTQAEQ